MNRKYPLLRQSRHRQQQGFVLIATLIIMPVLLILGGFTASVSFALATKTQLANSAETSALFLSLRDSDNNAKDVSAAQAISSQFSGLSEITNADIKITKLSEGYQVGSSLKTTMYLVPSDDQAIDMTVNSQIKAENEVSIQKIEMSLVLDYSGSMSGEESTMGETLRQISQLFSSDGGQYSNMKLAAAPFSSGITTALDNKCVTKTYTNWTGLYLDWELLLQQISPQLEQQSNACYSTPGVERLILTDDVADIETMIDQASRYGAASGSTDIDQGLLWGLRLLSPEWQEYDGGDQPAAFDSSPYPETKKILFLMTDAANSGDWCHLIENGSGNCASQIPLCEYAKELGVRIVTMYFTSGWGDNTQEQQNLRDCSSGGDDDHYLATDSTEVIEQFKQILDGIYSNQLRLVK